MIGKESSDVIDGQLFKNHVILGKGACLIAQDVLNSAELLRDLAVSGEGTLDFLIIVNFSGKNYFRKVKVDS